MILHKHQIFRVMRTDRIWKLLWWGWGSSFVVGFVCEGVWTAKLCRRVDCTYIITTCAKSKATSITLSVVEMLDLLFTFHSAETNLEIRVSTIVWILKVQVLPSMVYIIYVRKQASHLCIVDGKDESMPNPIQPVIISLVVSSVSTQAQRQKTWCKSTKEWFCFCSELNLQYSPN